LDFVTEHFAIGSRLDAQDLPELHRNGVGAVLNVAWDLDVSHASSGHSALGKPLEYQKVGLIDGDGNEPSTLLAAVFMLYQLRARHERTLVHCHAGISRSSTVLSLYLAGHDQTSFSDALDRIRAARPIASPHPELVRIAVALGDWTATIPLS
jgi:hypothetical protein